MRKPLGFDKNRAGSSRPDERSAQDARASRPENVPSSRGRMDQEDSERLYRVKKPPVGRLLRYFGPVWPLLLFSVLLAVAANLATLAKPFVLEHLIDTYITPGNFDMDAITRLGLFYLFLVLVCVGGASYAQSQVSRLMGQRIVHRMRTELFAHIQRMNMSFFDHHSSGSLLTRILSDIESVSEFFTGVVIALFQQTVLLVGIVVSMLTLDPRLTLLSSVLIPVIFGITMLYRTLMRRNFVKVKAQLSRINSFLAENIIGMRIVQIFRRERVKADEFHELGARYYKLGFREVMLHSLGGPLMTSLGNLASAILIVASLGGVENGTVQIGVLYAFITLVGQLFQPITQIADQFTTIQSAMVSAQRVFAILDNSEGLEDLESGVRPDGLRGEIEFRHVWFAYNDEDWVLRDVSFRIEPGWQAAFVGATGSGKSTIIGLLARFYTIQRGEILLDGRPIEEYNLVWLRRQVAVVMQDVFLFSGDVAHNIRLGDDEIDDEHVWGALRFIGADGFVCGLPDGIHSRVVERGATFSAGQRQLVSFARAVAFNPGVLILDEATASIDTETERAINAAMEQASKNRTMLIVAHRLSTVRYADVIFVLDHGVILEQGNHESLMRRNGRYAQLVRLTASHNSDELQGEIP